MSVVPGLPPPPPTHPASPHRNREMSTSPRSYSGSPGGYAAGGYGGEYAPHAVGYSHGHVGSPGGEFGRGYDEEKMKEEMRHREVAAHISRGIGCGSGSPGSHHSGSPSYGASNYQSGIAGYRSPRQYQPVNVGVPASHPVYDSPVHPIGYSNVSHAYVPATPQYTGSPQHHVPSPGTPTHPVTPGEGESPRRIRAWGASGTLH
eukprot:TRINITY_DN21122_c0_g1_i1.p1 TRINITY_DN21122_c0_g1~~TRINITY_DN21122_c0_g1_i1.p1  ORF type:complete len:204 (+),score=8.22 TRINITY_DN21122_c0_g1_i1:13-624(+)